MTLPYYNDNTVYLTQDGYVVNLKESLHRLYLMEIAYNGVYLFGSIGGIEVFDLTHYNGHLKIVGVDEI